MLNLLRRCINGGQNIFHSFPGTYNNVRAVRNISEFVVGIFVWTGQGYVKINLDSVQSVMPNLPYNCMLLDIDQTPELKSKDIHEVDFIFRKSIFGLEILIGDRDLYTDRDIKQNKFFSSGENIYISKSRRRTSIHNSFIVKLSQQKFVEADNVENCAIYPTRDYQTYNDCDKTYINNVLSTYSPNFVPLWSTQDMEEVSRLLSYPGTFPNNTVSYEDLYDGYQISSCPLPCTQTFVDTRSISYVKNEVDLDSIAFTFVEKIEITLYNNPKVHLIDFIFQVNKLVGVSAGGLILKPS